MRLNTTLYVLTCLVITLALDSFTYFSHYSLTEAKESDCSVIYSSIKTTN
jgi:hypothetical protein